MIDALNMKGLERVTLKGGRTIRKLGVAYYRGFALSKAAQNFIAMVSEESKA